MVPNMTNQGILVSGLTLLLAPLAWSHPGPGIVVDQQGNVYFVHGILHRIMKIDAVGKLTIFVQGEDGKKLSAPHHLVLDRQDNLYSVGDRDGVIWRIAPDATTTQVYPPADWYGIKFIGSGGDPFTIDSQGNIYGVNSRQERYTQILQISREGRIAVWAGGDWGLADGQGAQAKFGELHGACFAWSPEGSLYVTDSGTYLRKTTPAGAVTTLADSSGRTVQFQGAHGLACDARGNVYVADSSARRIYQVTAAGSVSPLAGSGQRGSDDGTMRTATFQNPVGVALGRDGTIYVLDYLRDAPSVRRISINGTVTTIASAARTR